MPTALTRILQSGSFSSMIRKGRVDKCVFLAEDRNAQVSSKGRKKQRYDKLKQVPIGDLYTYLQAEYGERRDLVRSGDQSVGSVRPKDP